MLRIYKPIDANPIYKLHTMVEHLVCEVWCKADGNDCLNKLNADFKTIVYAYDWLKRDVVEIDVECQKLSAAQKASIINAFKINNNIEDLCDGKEEPILLDKLPEIVASRMKPLFVRFYEDLLNKAKVSGDKLEYYKALYQQNRYTFCPCCGYVAFESGQTEVREAYDHYLPKSEYPFASVNFKNLVPLCYKCNSDRKKTKDPLKNKRKAYYPFRKGKTDIKIDLKISDGFIKSMYEAFVNNIDEENEPMAKISDFELSLSSETEPDQVKTWDDLFEIKKRFSDRTGQFSFRVLNEMRSRFKADKNKNGAWTFEQTIDENIGIFESDKFIDEKYLKIPFLNAIKKCQGLMRIYS